MQPMVVDSEAEKAAFARRINRALSYAGVPDDRSRRTWVRKKFGVSLESARKWVTGESIPATKRIPHIAAALGVRSEWLLSGRGDMLPESDNGFLEVGPDVGDYRAAPMVGTAQLGPEGHWYELDYPPGHGEGMVDVPTKDPNAYAIRVRGNSMAPAIRNGWIIVVEPNHELVPTEYVLVRTTDGRSMVKELIYDRPDELALNSVNDAYGREYIPRSEIEISHYIGFVVPPSKIRLD